MQNTRAVVRQMFEDRTAGSDEFRVPDLTDAILTEIRTDDDLLASFLDQHVRPTVYEIGLEMLARWRRQKAAGGVDIVLVGEYGATRQKIERKTRIRRLLWLNRAEHVGDRHIRIRAMKRADLMTAGAERIARGEAELRYGMFLIEVGNRLKGDDRVEDAFTEEQLDDLYANIGTTSAAKTA